MIYTVTTIVDLEKGFDTGRTLSCRTVGYFHSLDDAMKALDANYGNMYEDGWYPHAVIEEVEEGLYPCNDTKYWYTWYDATQKYLPSVMPDQVRAMYKNHEIMNFHEIG